MAAGSTAPFLNSWGGSAPTLAGLCFTMKQLGPLPGVQCAWLRPEFWCRPRCFPGWASEAGREVALQLARDEYPDFGPLTPPLLAYLQLVPCAACLL